MDVLVAYDIADTDGKGAKRLRRVAKVCESYGVRIQFSVFECRLSPVSLTRLIGEIQDEIDKDLDSVLVYRFAGRIEEARTRLGREGQHELGEPWLV